MPAPRRKYHRLNIPGHAHELTFSCYNRLPLLLEERHCRYLSEGLCAAKIKHSLDIWAYVFMPEHVHLLLWPRQEEYSVPDILLSIKQSVARKAILHMRKHAPSRLSLLATGDNNHPYHFWQPGGGYDRNIFVSKTVIQVVNYIHNNPVRKGLAKSLQEWYWSSAADWLGHADGPIPIDRLSFPIV